MFEVLDSIEDSHTNFEEFPFDHLDSADDDLKVTFHRISLQIYIFHFQKTLLKLESCEKTLAKNEMTINIAQAENARERITVSWIRARKI